MIDLEQEKYESLPEFIREPYPDTTSRGKQAPPMGTFLKRMNGQKQPDSFLSDSPAPPEPYIEEDQAADEFAAFSHSKTPELEVLWPGVDHDFLHVSKRGPSFYLTLGFLAGAIVSIIGIWIYALITHSSMASTPATRSQKMVVTVGATSATRARQGGKSRGGSAEVTTMVSTGSDAELVVPAFSTYEVKSGDTLAVIAGKAYHRVSPRLLDAICRANGLRSADVLTLGQKIALPEYRPRINQSTPNSN